MPNKMLIDASHREETRVVVTRGSRIEEFDFESQDKKQLRGNIYLARVTRVEPSLQAAFIEYGGNRHGFLAFSEIHPDYYQIPVADRQALLRADAEAHEAAEDDEEGENGEERRGRRRRRGGKDRSKQAGDTQSANTGEELSDGEAEPASLVEIEEFSSGEENSGDQNDSDAHDGAEEGDDSVSEGGDSIEPMPAVVTEREDQPGEEADSDREPPAASNADAALGEERSEPSDDDAPGGPSSMAMTVDAEVVSEPIPEAPEALRGEVEEVPHATSEDGEVESVGAGDALEEVRERRRAPPRRHYKIQEVIKRRQILLVQVVKEERGNKGAALTTYLSLAGRYSVLMPNTARGGGISRKITDAADRKRLKDVVKDLDVPQGMGVILRTAGENRTKVEIKRDYEYLMRMWETVRTLTLQSTAPALVYEEGSLIKRSVRDLYNKDIDEVLVAGEEGYREAKDFMRMLMPSHAKVVQPYRDPTPIFAKNGIEAQLDRMLQPQVTLKSGGYIVINQTEALVSIDVNSGRSTREHSIEDTALQTNLEAAEEVARQLRLRDLAGLIVIDFIDMEENRNNRAVEKKIKDCLKNDRARIQVGRISHFGLLEMSRQRIRTSMLESTMKPCPHCGGTGHVRSDSSVALLVVRSIEEFLLKDSHHHITVRTPAQTAFYVLNHKRSTLSDFERRFGVTITVEADETVGAQHYVILRGAVAEKPLSMPDEASRTAVPSLPEEPEVEVEEEDAVSIGDDAEETQAAGDDAEADESGDSADRRRRKRRRRRGGGREREHGVSTDAAATAEAAADVGSEGADGEEPESAGAAEVDAEAAGDAESKKRRRGKRGGRRSRRDEAAGSEDEVSASGTAGATGEDTGTAVQAVATAADMSRSEEPAENSADDHAPLDEAAQPSGSDPTDEEEGVAAVAHAADDAPAEVAAVKEEAADVPSADATPDEAPAARPRSNRRRQQEADSTPSAAPTVSSADAESAGGEEKPKRGGWWQRKSFF